MVPSLLVRFRPTGPWRIGPDDGARDRVDLIYRSDSLYSAVCGAMAQLGTLDDWLEDTARNPQESAVRFSSCFPWQDDILFVVPPRSIWPATASARLRAKGARFVPLAVVASLLAEQPLEEERWVVDGLSGCLIPADKNGLRGGPVRVALRSNAAVDRVSSGNIHTHRMACLEFAPDAGLWTVVAFANDEAANRWSGPVEAALRLLADSGFGGKRSLGWGRSQMPELTRGILPDMILPDLTLPKDTSSADTPAGEPSPPLETAYWLLSLFSPGGEDSVDWQRGDYSMVVRGGRIESEAGSGQVKKLVRMVEEGSVLLASSPPRGVAKDVAPEGFGHPVFRAGFAVSISIPWRMSL
jgi:CRISPR type III-A-associated RAMP protein Csm4